MDARENLLRLVNFESPDYIAMTFHINDSCWHHYPQAELCDLMASHPFLFPDFQGSEQHQEIEYPPFARAGEKFIDPWGCVWETPDDGIIGTVTKHPLESWDDFDNFKAPDPNKSTHWGPIDWNRQSKYNGPAVDK